MIVYDIGGPASEGLNQSPRGNATVSSPQTGRTSSDLSGIAADLTSGVVKGGVGYGIAQSGLPGISGVPGAIAAGVNAGLSGATAEDIGYAALTGGFTSAVSSGLSKAGVPGAVTSGAFGLARESFRDNPNYGRALTSSAVPGVVGTVTGLLAGPVAGYLAGTLAGYATEHSLLDGYLGDMTDSRSREKDRDIAEDHGFTDTGEMARADMFGDLPGAYGFGLSDAVSSTTTGNLAESASLTDTVAEGLMSQASTNAFGDPANLTSFADKLGLMEAAPATKGSFTGDPFGHSVQEGWGDIAANLGIGGVNGASAPESPMGWGDVAKALGLTSEPEKDSLLGKAQSEGAFDGPTGSGTDGSGTGQGATDGSDGGAQDGSGV